MSLVGDEDESEEKPLLPQDSYHQDGQACHLSKSVLWRARIVLLFVPIFMASLSVPRDTLLAQYLVDRLSHEAGIVNRTKANPCVDDNSTAARQSQEIQTETTRLLTNYGLAQCIPSLLACFVIGSYSDFFGRRVLLRLIIFGAMVKTLVLSAVIWWKLDLSFLYLGYLVDGSVGSWFAMLVVMYSMSSDTTVGGGVKAKILWITLITSTSSAMQAGTNMADGYLIDTLGYFNASLLLSSMSVLSFIVVLFSPETLNKDLIPKQVELNPLKHARKLFGFYFFDGTARKKATFSLAMGVFVFVVAGELNNANLDALYQLHRPFCWTSEQIGIYQAVRVGAAQAFGLFWWQFVKICFKDETIVFIAIVFQVAAYATEAYVKKSWQFYLVPAMLIPFSPFFSIIRGFMAHQAAPHQQGALYSSIAVMEATCQLASATAFNKIYGATNSTMAGLVFLVAAGCSVVGLAFYIGYLCVVEKPTRDKTLETTVNVQVTADDIDNTQGVPEFTGRVYCRTSSSPAV